MLLDEAYGLGNKKLNHLCVLKIRSEGGFNKEVMLVVTGRYRMTMTPVRTIIAIQNRFTVITNPQN